MMKILGHLSILVLSLFFLVSVSAVVAQENDQDKCNKPKNIILMIGDGMGVSHIYAAMTANKGRLNLERCRHIGFIKTYSLDRYITDSGAAGTALATGHKTNNKHISVDSHGNKFATILEIAERNGLSSGLVATSYITHATPASFIAHNVNRNDYEALALNFLNTDIDVFIGGGKEHFINRKDGLNLIDSLKAHDYQVVYNIQDLHDIHKGKVAGLLYDGHPPKHSEGRNDMLERSSLKAIELLSQDQDGFFMMIEGSQIDWAGHDNDSEYLVDETLDFDKTVGAVLNFAEKDGETLVIITADHETGGYAIVDGDIEKGDVTGKFSTDRHTATMVPVFAFGPGAEEFMGIYDNTEIFDKCVKLFGFEKDNK